jgi:hypothetical protein
MFNLMFFFIIMVVLGIGIFIVIIALREDGISSFQGRGRSADKTTSTDKVIRE